MSTTLGNVLQTIESIKYQIGGRWAIFLPSYADNLDYEITANTPCKVVFVTKEEDEAGEVETDDGMFDFINVALAQQIVRSARSQKPDCSEQELVMCLNYYLEYDAFYDFE